MFSFTETIDKHYPRGSALRVIYMGHCESVARMALETARRLGLPLDPADIEAAAMLHDIGIFLCDAPGIECRGTEPYIRHGVLGADLLRSEGAPEKYALVAERHTGSGLTPEQAAELGLPGGRSYLPASQLERLICYCDKFYSKSGSRERKQLEKVRAQMARFGDDSLARFDRLHAEFR